MAKTRESIRQSATGDVGVDRSVAGNQWQPQVFCQVDELAVEKRVVAQAVAVEFDVNVFPPEELDERFGGGERGGFVIAKKRFAKRSFAITG